MIAPGLTCYVDPLDAPATVPYASAWAPLGDGYEITVEPLRVEDGGDVRWWRATYRDALALAHEWGAGLPTSEQLDALRDLAILLRPVTLQAGPQMNSTAYYERHDRGAVAQLDAIGWTPESGRPTLGIGKHWIAGAPPGRSWLKGWPVGDGWIQQGPHAPHAAGPHNDLHCDYSSTVLLVRPA